MKRVLNECWINRLIACDSYPYKVRKINLLHVEVCLEEQS